jgi:ADP-ribose pyrophosphatase YjhB (NUDIX family)
MTKWNYCPECTEKLLEEDEGSLSCPKGHFTKYHNPVASTAAFIRNNDEYLIIKRAKEPQKDWWDLPGGFMAYDETPEEALLREIEEETQLKNLKINKFIGAFPGSYAGIQKVLDLVYLIDSEDRDLRLSDENTEYRWVKLKDMPELAFEDINAARQLLLKTMV